MYCTLSPAIGDGRTSDAARGAWRRCGNGRLDLVCISGSQHVRTLAQSAARPDTCSWQTCSAQTQADTTTQTKPHRHNNHADAPSQAQPHRRSHPPIDGIRHTFKPLRIPIDHHPHEKLAHPATGSRGSAAASQNVGLPPEIIHGHFDTTAQTCGRKVGEWLLVGLERSERLVGVRMRHEV